jgi:beta-lactamase superfamily II metal-dependent hydrolase
VGLRTAAPVVLLIALTVVAGCAGTSGSDRSFETIELTVTTPSTDTTGPTRPQYRTVQFLGPGASAVITDGSNHSLVVDAGADPNATRVRRTLSRRGIETYDLWITGFNETRLGGAPTLVRERPPENIGFSGLTATTSVYDRFLRAVVDGGLQYVFFGVTERFAYGHEVGLVDVLAPPKEYLADRDPAHNELVLEYEADETTVVWVGDPGQAEQQWLLENADSLEASVLVLSAGASPSDQLLDAVDPDTVVVQGRDGANRTAALVDDGATDVYRPGIEGTVTLRLRADGSNVERATPTPSAPTAKPPSTVTPRSGTTAQR